MFCWDYKTIKPTRMNVIFMDGYDHMNIFIISLLQKQVRKKLNVHGLSSFFGSQEDI